MAYQGPCVCPNCSLKIKAGRVHLVLESVGAVQNRCLNASLKEMQQALGENVLVHATQALSSDD